MIIRCWTFKDIEELTSEEGRWAFKRKRFSLFPSTIKIREAIECIATFYEQMLQ